MCRGVCRDVQRGVPMRYVHKPWRKPRDVHRRYVHTMTYAIAVLWLVKTAYVHPVTYTIAANMFSIPVQNLKKKIQAIFCEYEEFISSYKYIQH